MRADGTPSAEAVARATGSGEPAATNQPANCASGSGSRSERRSPATARRLRGADGAGRGVLGLHPEALSLGEDEARDDRTAAGVDVHELDPRVALTAVHDPRPAVQVERRIL